MSIYDRLLLSEAEQSDETATLKDVVRLIRAAEKEHAEAIIREIGTF